MVARELSTFRLTMALSLAGLTSCAQPDRAPPASTPADVSIPSSPPALVVYPACTWKLAAEPVALTANDMTFLSAHAAASAGSMFVAYQLETGTPDRSQVVRARMFDAAGQAAGAEMLLSEPSGIHTTPVVFADDKRFFVAWSHQFGVAGFPGPTFTTLEGRWISQDGTMSPILTLPVGRVANDVHLTRLPNGYSLLWHDARTDGRSGDTLRRMVVDESMKPLSPEVALLDAHSFAGGELDEVLLADGSSFVAVASPGFRGELHQIHVIRMDAKGRVAGPVIELTSDAGEATRPSMLVTGNDVLVGWLAEPSVGQGPGTAMVAKLDGAGRMLVGPTAVGKSGTRFNGFELVSAGGTPTVLYAGGLVQRMTTSGQELGKAQVLAPSASTSASWMRFGRSDGLFFVTHQDTSQRVAHYAPLTCDEHRP